MRLRIGALALCLGMSTAQAEPAVTARATDLQAKPQADSATLASLPENARLEVLRRSGGWSEVKTQSGQTGWVRMLNLRFEGAGNQGAGNKAAPTGNPLNALNNLLSTGRTSNTATVTTGVRGLDEADLQQAQANPAELQRARGFAVDKNAAQAFAQRSKLAANRVEYLPEPAPVAPAGTGVNSMEGN